MSAWSVYLEAYGLLLAAMTLLWLVSVRLRNASIVDPLWGMTFVLAGGWYFLRTPDGDPGRKLLVMTLVTVWGLRLSIHLLWRNLGEPEDPRYQAFRRRFGPQRYWWVSFFQVFVLQGTLSWLIGAPLLGAQLGGGPLGWLDAVGAGVWLVGMVFEAGSDLQLARFRARRTRPDQLLTDGFWRYTRHPNYFGDSACWWGYGLLSIAAGGYAWALGAVLMTVLIIRVSGVALLERSSMNQKPGYAEYAARTSAFLPWFPRKPRATPDAR
ncbi:MAG: DUF1295 domain-containing protein [Myxococcales bacterium]|nr:DUF1295 domain-containing protein [Myxococcales bacterium]